MKLGLFAGLLVVVVGVVVALGAAKGKNKAVEVRLEPVGSRDLVSVVTASGKIEPDTKVDVLSDVQGRITRIAVKEGDLVLKGDFLLQIDPAIYQSAVSRAEALVASAQSDLIRARANQDQAKRALDRALELKKTNSSLITQEAVEQAQTGFDVARMFVDALERALA